jgi:hypothetical protein
LSLAVTLLSLSLSLFFYLRYFLLFAASYSSSLECFFARDRTAIDRLKRQRDRSWSGLKREVLPLG